MRIKKLEQRIKPEFKLTEKSESFDLRTIKTDFIVKQLESTIKQREMTVEKRIKKKFMQ